MLSLDLDILLISFRIARRVAVLTLASSPLDKASISIIFPLSVTCTFSLSFDTTNSKVNLPSDNSPK